jgi:hypothetical protein
LLNQAFFDRIVVYEDDVQAELGKPFKTLLSEELAEAAQQNLATNCSRSQRENALSLTEVLRSGNDKPAHFGAGLKETTLVELRGFEPQLYLRKYRPTCWFLRLVPIRSRSLPSVLFSGLDGVKSRHHPFPSPIGPVQASGPDLRRQF